ncbi:hypothetical protein B0J11DRAFT_348368 [Dendryphion nanum]|uniref:Uncharacterized protein n=1 Tax=Dendryphion nanum TaxID=256645 RepID=A0A9P9DPU1_9PLEO|nr:hypothetical protein B0J11DRAFT_348368 [Dendryphion nanum]
MSHNFSHDARNSNYISPSIGYNSVQTPLPSPHASSPGYVEQNVYPKAFDHNDQFESIPMQQKILPEYTQVVGSAPNHQSARWEPGFWRRFPVWSILAMIIVLACLVASLYILISSDGQLVNRWGYGIAPPVYLAITSVVANSLSAFALANGLVISFWRTALHGASLNELTRNYECGASFRRAIMAGFRRGGRITALACIFTLIGVLRGPLNQRASTVETNVRFDTQGSVQLNVAQTLPNGYTGVSQRSRTSTKSTSRLTATFNSIMQEYSARQNMIIGYRENCGDWCRTSVKGFGFNATCAMTEYKTTQNITASFTLPTFSTRATIYDVANGPVTGLPQWEDTGLRLNATWFIQEEPIQNTTRTFIWKSHICNLTAGTINYDIQLIKGTSQLTIGANSKSFERIKLESPNNLGTPTTVGGFQFALSYLFDATANLIFGGAVSSLNLEGALASQMFIENTTSAPFNTYNDPMKIMLDALQEIAFRTSLRAGIENTTITNAQQTVPYTGFINNTIYRTNRAYMGAAAAVSLTSLIAIGITFWGWWEMGRLMTLNPLEIAKAFDSPLLKNVGSNVPAYSMASEVLKTRIRYGECINESVVRTGYNDGRQAGEVTLGLRPDAGKPKRGQFYGP